MQHADDFLDDVEGGRGHLEPAIEGGDEVLADIFARVVVHVVVWAQQDLFFRR